jgi:hypothetical protein
MDNNFKPEPYSLYHTFSQNIPSENLSAADKKYIAKQACKTFTESQQIAFNRLILEHSLIDFYSKNEGKPSDMSTPPFDGLSDETEITYDINTLPKPLQWILFRFTKMCVEENSS